MGENEQGGMLRTVVVIGLIALIAAVIIGGVVAVKASMLDHQTTALQSISKANSQKDIDFTLTGTNGKLDKVVSHSEFVSKGYFANVVSGNEKNNDTSFSFPPYAEGNTNWGIQAELYLNGQKVNYIFENSDSDYLELSLDYTVKNAKSMTYAEANALNLDSRRSLDGLSGLMIGLRSDSYNWSKRKELSLNGDMSGTLTMQAPKSKVGSTYEAYVNIGNMNFDSIKLSNLRISNATH